MNIYKLKSLSVLAIALFGVFWSVAGYAENLLTVYQQALQNDPTFKQNYAAMRANREALPINIASLFPTISAAASFDRTRNSDDTSSTNTKTFYYVNNGGYSLSLNQPIFNAVNWAKVAGASATAKQADATFSAAAQDLILRTASAYFAVLQAEDFLRYTTAERVATGKQLNQSEQQYKVGLIPITNYYEAKANFDSERAAEIAAQNDLVNKKEALWQISGNHYATLDGLSKGDAPLLTPDPNAVESWVKAAEAQNYSLLASRYAATAAEDNIKATAAGHLPTLSAVGGFQYQYSDHTSTGFTGTLGFARSKEATLGLSMNLPLFQGGAVTAATRQADYLYQQALGVFEATHRSVVSQTRQDYIGIIALINKIHADKQAILSSKSAFLSIAASYKVGMRTMAEVLTAQANVYAAEKDYSLDQYSYIAQTLALKRDAGTLSVKDLEQINSWLADASVASDVATANTDTAVPATKAQAVPFKKDKTKIPVSDSYTIQLLVSPSETQVKQFIINHNLNDQAVYFAAHHNGKKEYVLVVGAYTTQAEAETALAALAPDLQKLNPVVASIDQLKRK